MKGLFASLSLSAIAMAMAGASAFAATTVSQSATAAVATILSIEFADSFTTTTFGGGTISWTNVDPSSNLVYPTGHVHTRADTAVICRYNGTGNWQLKMRFVSTNGMNDTVKYYMPQPSILGTPTNGTLGNSTPGPGLDWPIVPSTDFTAYTSGSSDRINTPFGTFVAITYALNPQGLQAGQTYSGTLTYTIVGGV